MEFLNLFWLVILLWSLVPVIQRRSLFMARLRLMRLIQKKRQSRLITMIHRQEALSFLGVPFRRFIDIDDSEAVLQAIRMTPPDTPIDMVLHTPGGLVLAAEQIAAAVKRHPAKVTVFVPHYAMSGGTLVALAADEIVMDPNAVLGPVDPQLGNLPAASILKAVDSKDKNEVDDKTLILADVASKAMSQIHEFVVWLLEDKVGAEKAREIAETLTTGRWTHDYPIACDQLTSMGLQVSCTLPPEIFALMALYPQAGTRRPSVNYVPMPGRAGDV